MIKYYFTLFFVILSGCSPSSNSETNNPIPNNNQIKLIQNSICYVSITDAVGPTTYSYSLNIYSDQTSKAVCNIISGDSSIISCENSQNYRGIYYQARVKDRNPNYAGYQIEVRTIAIIITPLICNTINY